MRNPNKVYSREALLNYVWGNKAMDSGDVRTVDVHVRRLRERSNQVQVTLSLYIQMGRWLLFPGEIRKTEGKESQ